MNATKRLVEDWDAVRSKIRTEEWAARIIDTVKPATDRWIAHYRDDAGRAAGWGHHYFCDKCFAALVFDPLKPGEHRCSGCGELRVAQEADDAWTYIYRTSSCSQVFYAAVMHKLYGGPEYMGYIRKVMSFLCEHYGSFQVRTPEGQEGRFSGTDLTDGVAVIWLLNGLELVKEELTEQELDDYKHRFLIPEAAFLIEKVGCTPNIICWMKAAAGMIGLFTGERSWCERAAEGIHGIKARLAEGLLPGGFWYEASFHYHFYCAEGLTFYQAFCKIYGYDFPELEDALLRMYRYPVNYAFPNAEFPNPSDGWPLLTFGTYAQQYEWIRNVHDEAPFRYALSRSYDENRIGGITRLLFGRNWSEERFETGTESNGLPDGLSRYDPDVYFAQLRSGEAAVFLKYGFVMRGHSHADLMHFELFLRDEVISRDISNSGYGSDLFREWQRKTAAHNSIMVDRQNQPNRPAGRMLSFDREGSACHAVAYGIYPGLGYSRSLRLEPDRLDDEFRVFPEDGHSDVHEFDWLFHCSGEPESDLVFAAAEPPGDKDGYQLMLDTARCDTDEAWEISWRMPDKVLTLRMEGCPGTSVYLFRGYEHRSDLTRWGVMVRRQGKEAAYKATYRFHVTD